ncbi:MAG: DegT/DnrJ/EryC1/StrS family aminotransferase [Bacillota bacterium]|nr:DegT/DnrJ/EryC1/StrS family aminotransferase [Bacillota bacterium]
MEFIDLKAQYKSIENEIKSNINTVLEHGKYIMGPEVALLEQELSEYAGAKYCVTCANGTDALQMALMAWNIGFGDAVFVPSFTFMSTAEVVNLQGATPIFVDISLDTFNMCPDSLENAIKKVIAEGKLKPKAVIPVDLFGQCAEFDKIIPLARKYKLLILEDGAQGFGGTINGKKACTFGDISTTSFFPAKPLGCYGDGGAIFTDNENWYETLKSIRVHGKGTMKYDNVRVGLNSRLDTMQAAIVLAKLHAFIEHELDNRHKYADMYTSILKDRVKTPACPKGFTSSWAQYTLLFDSSEIRDKVRDRLKEKGIPSMVYYPTPLHRQTVYKPLGYEEGSLPASEKAAKGVLSLPMHPYLSKEAVSFVAENVIKAFEEQ